MNHIRSHARAAFLLMLAAPLVHAETAIEHQVDIASAPHLALGRGARQVNVHYVHRKDDNANSRKYRTLLDGLRKSVANCVESNRRLGRPVRAPAAFPEQVSRVHHFDYSAPNRNILYVTSYAVQVADDCSLLESERRAAVLSSTKGECRIDLVAKKAEGVCDATGQADAAPFPRSPSRAQYDATGAALAADPRLAERMAAVRQLMGGARAPAEGGARVPAEQRTIAGHRCEITEGIPGVRTCISKDGSFVPAAGTEGVVLMGTFAQDSLTAVEAKFDNPVNPAIFTPYLAGGYTITSGGEQ